MLMVYIWDSNFGRIAAFGLHNPSPSSCGSLAPVHHLLRFMSYLINEIIKIGSYIIYYVSDKPRKKDKDQKFARYVDVRRSPNEESRENNDVRTTNHTQILIKFTITIARI
jgi:hypothetical protein